MSSDALPSEWVDELFKRLSVRYGKPFMARWDGVEIAEVKADWAEVLGGFKARPDCIAYALDNLPADRPPTATQFRDLCRSKPETSQALLPAPKPDPQRVAEALAPLAAARAQASQVRHPREWARSLHQQIQAGRKASPAIRAMVADVMRMQGWA